MSAISAGRDRACSWPRPSPPLCRSFTATALCGYLAISRPAASTESRARIAMGARHAINRNEMGAGRVFHSTQQVFVIGLLLSAGF